MCASVGDCRALICNQTNKTLFDVSTAGREHGKKERNSSYPIFVPPNSEKTQKKR